MGGKAERRVSEGPIDGGSMQAMHPGRLRQAWRLTDLVVVRGDADEALVLQALGHCLWWVGHVWMGYVRGPPRVYA